MVVPITFRGGGEKSIQSYTFTEFASGRGIVTFYAGDASGANVLSTTTFYPANGQVGYDAEAAAGGTTEFTTTFERPIIAKGTCIINQPVAIDNFSADSEDISINLIMNLLKRSDGTDTLMASGSNLLSANLPTNTGQSQTFCQVLTIPQTHFKIGDSLVYKIIATTAGSSSTGNSQAIVAFDPKNAQTHTRFTWESSQVAIYMPFVIDL